MLVAEVTDAMVDNSSFPCKYLVVDREFTHCTVKFSSWLSTLITRHLRVTHTIYSSIPDMLSLNYTVNLYLAVRDWLVVIKYVNAIYFLYQFKQCSLDSICYFPFYLKVNGGWMLNIWMNYFQHFILLGPTWQ